jgi:hypothetical protein
MTFGGFGGPGSTPGPFHGALAQSEVSRARAGVRKIPDDVIAAAREERALRRLQRRVRRWQRFGRIR